MRKRLLNAVLILVIALAVTGLSTQRAGAYYGGGLYGGIGGLYGGLYGGGLYGGLYGGLMGGLYGGGLYGGMYGMMGGLYGMYGGMYGGGMYGMMGGLYSPFGLQNMYYSVDTGTGLSYQVPFLQIAPMLGVAGMYNALFPSLFNPQSYYAPQTFAPAATAVPVDIIT
jgi:hypothetical protein